MAFVDAGYDGTVDEVQFAKLLNRYAVVGPDDFKASNVAGADRQLSVANGTALGPGSLNVGTAFSPVQFDAVTSGTTRWDLVVLRRDWQPPGGVTGIVVIKGGATPVLPARNQTPGVIDDQPLYLQQVNAGSTSLGTRLDLRVWVGPGGAEAADKLALTYLTAPGAAVKIGQVTHRYELQGNGVWGWKGYYPGGALSYSQPSFFATTWSSNTEVGVAQLVVPDPGVPYRVRAVAGVVTFADSAAGLEVKVRLDSIAGPVVGVLGHRPAGTASGLGLTVAAGVGGLSPTRTGPVTVVVTVRRAYGSGTWAVAEGGNALGVDLVLV